VPTVVFGGEEYGTGSSRDWAAKGTQLLGVKAVVARSFERIHRSNLVGMGVLPLQFKGDDSRSRSASRATRIRRLGIAGGMKPQQDITLVIKRKDGTTQGGPAAVCASTRRSRSTTSGTAASCRTCCANWRTRHGPPDAARSPTRRRVARRRRPPEHGPRSAGPCCPTACPRPDVLDGAAKLPLNDLACAGIRASRASPRRQMISARHHAA
jgi:hypothetical protein